MHTLPRHQCIIYEGSPILHLQSLALTIIGKLKGKKRCLYLNSPGMVAGMHLTLADMGLDTKAEIEKGSLILTSDQSHLVDGQFDVDRMLGLLHSGMNQALADGYIGLWATGDMSWELGNQNNFTKILEYERRLESFIESNPAMSGVCQYCRDTTPSHAVEAARQTHQALYIDDVQLRMNPDYQPTAA